MNVPQNVLEKKLSAFGQERRRFNQLALQGAKTASLAIVLSSLGIQLTANNAKAENQSHIYAYSMQQQYEQLMLMLIWMNQEKMIDLNNKVMYAPPGTTSDGMYGIHYAWNITKKPTGEIEITAPPGTTSDGMYGIHYAWNIKQQNNTTQIKAPLGTTSDGMYGIHYAWDITSSNIKSIIGTTSDGMCGIHYAWNIVDRDEFYKNPKKYLPWLDDYIIEQILEQK